MWFIAVSCVLAGLLLCGCSSGPTAPTLDVGSKVVRPAADWRFGTAPRYALAEQYQYAGAQAEAWLDPIQQAVTQQLNDKGWRSMPLDEADVWVAIGVTGSHEVNDKQIFAQLGIPPAQQTKPEAQQGTLAIVLLERHTQQVVWSTTISLASEVTVTDQQRQHLSQQLAGELLGSLPSQ
ncbi:DUF4136 domain-containing protein [Aeromonas cavernicola]|uniref:DUF4136 domain-containing protein n=1 Tax=Aeromonas cavernicola TaxID=1006623 RepID=A0A2H9U948_9GAMM|nr:DUF4136 domain-containing protein [Aeromonas cavernicola]PJG60556.1 hypothetical protein CUC53_00675 [Aeromonas cavernicola]